MAEKLVNSGVERYAYSPVGSGWDFLVPERWRRLHRKLCVMDEQVVFRGGINVLDDFYDPNHGTLEAPRFDFAVSVPGPLAAKANDAMALLWWRVQAGYSARQRHVNEAWQKFRAADYGGRTDTKSLSQPESLIFGAFSASPRRKAALLLQDNLRNRHSIERVYRQEIVKARHEIIIANTYFLPGGKPRRALIPFATHW